VELEMFGQQPGGKPDLVNTRMQELSTQVKELSSDVHRISHELHPAKLEQLGLAAAVRGFCKELSLANEIAIRFESDELPPALPKQLALCLYRITQEALQNVVKHSHAISATVQLTARDGEIRLHIADDGDGFDPATVPAGGSLGLVSMRERVRLVEGALTVESKPGAGTRVEVRVTVPSATSHLP
ncbi:MAG TPA: sensor histidine kinase, partial [Verrucomicrobiae bacterium]|nr:sensor histidine kinase [Verrucomicrobiae bacterium]